VREARLRPKWDLLVGSGGDHFEDGRALSSRPPSGAVADGPVDRLGSVLMDNKTQSPSNARQRMGVIFASQDESCGRMRNLAGRYFP
jgi:hypothetical protein